MTSAPPPVKNKNLKVNFCGGHFEWGGQQFLEGANPVYGACFSHGEDGDKIQRDNKCQQKQQLHTVCGERSLHLTWRTHGLMRGRLREAVYGTRYCPRRLLGH